MVLCMGVGRKKGILSVWLWVLVCAGGVRMGKILPGCGCWCVQGGGSGWEKSCPVVDIGVAVERGVCEYIWRGEGKKKGKTGGAATAGLSSHP